VQFPFFSLAAFGRRIGSIALHRKEMQKVENNGIVLVMGVTGAGKSYFIDKLKPGVTDPHSGLESSECKTSNFN